MKEALRRIFRRMRFHQQLVLTLTVGLASLALLSSFAITSITSRTLMEKLLEEGRRIAENFAAQSTLALLYQSAENAKEAATLTLGFPDIRAVAIYDQEHEVLLKEGTGHLPLTGPAVIPNEVRLEQETDQDWHFIGPVYTDPGGATEETPFAVVSIEPELIGFVRVVMSKQTLKAMVADILRANFFVSIMLAAVLLVLLLAITRRLTTPLRNLATLMQRAEHGEAQLRAPLQGPNDVVEMESAFNTMMDVLETRETELKQAHDAAVRLAQVKSEFAANVSHELRTPLNAVLGMLELLEDMDLTAKQSEYVNVASDAGKALLTLINDVLDFSRIDSGKLEFRAEDIWLDDFLDEIISLLASQAQRKDLDLGYVIASDVPVEVRADPARLRQVLINFLSNAIKFTEQGEIGVEVEATVNAQGRKMLRFDVWDTGIGIPSDAQQRIFEAFSQVDSSSTRKYGGTGLGLTICRQLVALMGGEIGVESRPAKGSRFWFTMHLDEAVQSLQQSRVDRSGLPAGLQVMIVDDSAVSRGHLEYILNAWGCRCTSVANALQALQHLRASTTQDNNFDLVFVDQSMPGIRGEKLLAMMAEDAGIAEVKTVLLTNEPELANSEKRPANLFSYLTKPISKARLYDCIIASITASDSKESPAPFQEKKTAAYLDGCILVVEDNRANQYVAMGMLERLGCRVKVVSDGQEALEAITREAYDLIMMDCQMPRMDGYEATRRIRKLEARYSQIPIIAMTAHARQGDKEKCLAAGMDDYLAKPLKLEDLCEKLKRWLTPSEAKSSAPVAADDGVAISSTASIPDRIEEKVLSELRRNIGAAFVRMVEAFIEDTPDYIQSLKTAAADDDSKMLADLAHTIKGSSRNFGANRLARICKQLEDLGRSGSTVGAMSLLIELDGEFALVQKALLHEVSSDEGKRVIGHGESQARILVVDDDRGLRRTLSNVLKQDGHQIEEAASGTIAMALCERQLPDLVLLDAVMPGMDGFTVCQQIRQLPDAGRTPIVIITALDDESSVERAFSSGATDYIPKPVHFAVLRKRISRLLQAILAEKQVLHLAYSDPLTGLANRAFLMERLEETLQRSRSVNQMLAILLLDLDRFKLINDTHGHDVGDMLLKAAAERIKRNVRSNDIVARLGGDEFTIILDDIKSLEIITGVAEKICAALARPFKFVGEELFVTASIGVAIFPKDSTDLETLMKYADIAMYHAKEQRNGYQFYEGSNDIRLSDRFILENELRRALERNELVLYYQPQAALATGDIVGVEALVRWKHPQRGLLMPFEFIPAAEEAGLIVAVGEWMLREACTQIETWLRRGYLPLRVAMKISGRQLEQHGFVEVVAGMLKEIGLSSDLLEFEIAESALIKQNDETVITLRHLREIGIHLSIDGFGVGYSSLGYLKSLPIESFKIDRSFVHDVGRNPNIEAVLGGIIALAKDLRLRVVAEGVESPEQEAFLREKECDVFQGDYLSEPLLAEIFEKKNLEKKDENSQLQKRHIN